MTVGQEFDAFHATVKEDIARIGEAAALFREAYRQTPLPSVAASTHPPKSWSPSPIISRGTRSRPDVI